MDDLVVLIIVFLIVIFCLLLLPFLLFGLLLTGRTKTKKLKDTQTIPIKSVPPTPRITHGYGTTYYREGYIRRYRDGYSNKYTHIKPAIVHRKSWNEPTDILMQLEMIGLDTTTPEGKRRYSKLYSRKHRR